ncbi:MAG: Uma2 family endonuclease [Thermomicrobiales bacterium]
MAAVSHHLDFDDLQRLREERTERLELIDGELFVTPSPSMLHQLVSKRLNRILLQAVDDAGIGAFFYAPLDVKLGPRDVVQPDLVVVLKGHFTVFTDAAIAGSPDLAVEIVSSTTGRTDRVIKRDRYAQFGVPEYWLIDPEARQITIHADPREGHYQIARTFTDTAVSTIIPDLTVDVAALLSPVPEE